MILKDFNKGEQLTAEWVNAVNEMLKRLENINGNNGVRVSYTPSSINIANMTEAASPIRLAQINVGTGGSVFYIKNNTYGFMTLLKRQPDLWQLSIRDAGDLTENTFKLKVYDGSKNEDGTPHFETTDFIDANTGARGLQIILRRLESIGDNVETYCGKFPKRTIYAQFTGPLAGKEITLEVTESTVTSDTGHCQVVVSNALAPSTDPNDKIPVFMCYAADNAEFEFPNGYVGSVVYCDGRWETIGGFFAPPTRCTPYLTTNMSQPFLAADDTFTSAGDGDSPWTITPVGLYLQGRYDCTFTSAQLTAGSCLTDTLILTGFNAAPSIAFGANFTDDINTAIQINFATNSTNVPYENVKANIVKAVLIDTNTSREGNQLLPDYANAGRVIEGIAGESHHEYGPPNWYTSSSGDVTISDLYGDPVSGSPLSTGHNVADDSDTVVAGLLDGSLGIAIQIEAHHTSLTDPVPDVTIEVYSATLQILYNT